VRCGAELGRGAAWLLKTDNARPRLVEPPQQDRQAPVDSSRPGVTWILMAVPGIDQAVASHGLDHQPWLRKSQHLLYRCPLGRLPDAWSARGHAEMVTPLLIRASLKFQDFFGWKFHTPIICLRYVHFEVWYRWRCRTDLLRLYRS
jgi:hypothetical protein